MVADLKKKTLHSVSHWIIHVASCETLGCDRPNFYHVAYFLIYYGWLFSEQVCRCETTDLNDRSVSNRVLSPKPFPRLGLLFVGCCSNRAVSSWKLFGRLFCLFNDTYLGWSFRQWPQFFSVWQAWNDDHIVVVKGNRCSQCRRKCVYVARQRTNMKPSLFFQLFRPPFHRVTRLSSRKQANSLVIISKSISGEIISYFFPDRCHIGGRRRSRQLFYCEEPYMWRAAKVGCRSKSEIVGMGSVPAP